MIRIILQDGTEWKLPEGGYTYRMGDGARFNFVEIPDPPKPKPLIKRIMERLWPIKQR